MVEPEISLYLCPKIGRKVLVTISYLVDQAKGKLPVEFKCDSPDYCGIGKRDEDGGRSCLPEEWSQCPHPINQRVIGSSPGRGTA